MLADEINRTPPKTQSALLEAMQERQVSVDGIPRPLPEPFLVVATQNPIEYEGTYPLPEAQLDRFIAKLDVGYPSADDEAVMLRLAHRGWRRPRSRTCRTSPRRGSCSRSATSSTRSAVADPIVGYVVTLVRRTRELPSVALGAESAGRGASAGGRQSGRSADGTRYVIPDDVAAVAPAVLRHRITLRPEAELEHYRADDAVAAAISSVPVPR